MNSRFALISACVFGGLAAGFGAGRLAARAPGAESASAVSTPPPPPQLKRDGRLAAERRGLFTRHGLPLPPEDGENPEPWRAAIEGLARRDPSAAFAAAGESDDPGSWIIAFAALAATDPQAAAAALRELDPFERPLGGSPVWSRLLALLARSDPALAAAVASDKDGRVESFVPRFLEQLGQQDWALAAEVAEKLPGHTLNRQAQAKLAERWAETDPRAALAWARRTLGTKQYREVLEKCLRTLSLEEKRDVLDQLPPGNARMTTCGAIAREWVAGDPAACLEWAASLSSAPQREVALNTAAAALCESDPRQALRVIAQLPDPMDQRRLVYTALGAWRREDPAAAKAYAATVPDDALRTSLLAWLVVPPVEGKASGGVKFLYDEPFEKIEFQPGETDDWPLSPATGSSP